MCDFILIVNICCVLYLLYVRKLKKIIGEIIYDWILLVKYDEIIFCFFFVVLRVYWILLIKYNVRIIFIGFGINN